MFALVTEIKTTDQQIIKAFQLLYEHLTKLFDMHISDIYRMQGGKLQGKSTLWGTGKESLGTAVDPTTGETIEIVSIWD